MSRKICPECNQNFYKYGWCNPCNSKHFQNDFNNWTSGNDKIDKFIQYAQLNVNAYKEIIEWIPFDRFKDVKQIGKGEFGTIYFAQWMDGSIEGRDIKNQRWVYTCRPNSKSKCRNPKCQNPKSQIPNYD